MTAGTQDLHYRIGFGTYLSNRVVQANDIKKAFLQIRTHESERDALRFHWRPISLSEVESYSFTRVFFGLAPSPFLLGGVLESHLDASAKKYPEETEHLRRSFYVDDVLSGGQNIQQARTRKKIATEIMNDASLELHKWHSNEPQLEYRPHSTPYEEQSYAKQQLQTQSRGSKLLGVKWNKENDTIAVQFLDSLEIRNYLRQSCRYSKSRRPGHRCRTLVEGPSLVKRSREVARQSCDSEIPSVGRGSENH